MVKCSLELIESPFTVVKVPVIPDGAFQNGEHLPHLWLEFVNQLNVQRAAEIDRTGYVELAVLRASIGAADFGSHDAGSELGVSVRDRDGS